MKYTVKKLDGRYAYNNYFEYCVEFPRNQFGPVEFHTVMAWMVETYGYSAEVRDFMYIRSMLLKRQQFNVPNSDAPDFVNQQWSWTNGSENLRVYLKNEPMLTLFKLKWMED
jgi:hypothetical protein|tara:strand:+ start:40 stop:375 length:336 start_codon:yes stop_codon:yes gene_type:complete